MSSPNALYSVLCSSTMWILMLVTTVQMREVCVFLPHLHGISGKVHKKY